MLPEQNLNVFFILCVKSTAIIVSNVETAEHVIKRTTEKLGLPVSAKFISF